MTGITITLVDSSGYQTVAWYLTTKEEPTISEAHKLCRKAEMEANENRPYVAPWKIIKYEWSKR